MLDAIPCRFAAIPILTNICFFRIPFSKNLVGFFPPWQDWISFYSSVVYSIFIQSALDAEITNNTVYSNYLVGIFNDKSTGTLIADNTVTNDGFYFLMSSLGDYATLTVSDNTVNGKPLGFVYGLIGTVLSSNDFGQLVLVNCDDTIVKDLIIRDTDYALALIGCDSVIVDNCDFSYNFLGGVGFDTTMNCTLTNTLCNHNHIKPGITLSGTTNSVIKNCTSSNNYFGLYIVSSVNFTVLNSTFNQNTITNAYLVNGPAGNIRFNAFTNAGALGMQFVNIDYVNISHNLFESNTQYAIHLDSASMGNWIHHNAFISNNLGGTSQAYDNTMDLNMWDDPWNMEGNYWDDWVSGNYTIDGLGNANDSYPYGSIPPGVSEFSQYAIYFVLLIPVVFVSISIIRKRKK
ncbi:MAG: right-handed parallel beta-helix repeat-containing protein [Candidatus Heimdallarchaeota archaeon]|nr:right-handed parallel beta-helix repeat-containing protein [Candidatus Heimdallarchaeota archaeon]